MEKKNHLSKSIKQTRWYLHNSIPKWEYYHQTPKKLKKADLCSLKYLNFWKSRTIILQLMNFDELTLRILLLNLLQDKDLWILNLKKKGPSHFRSIVRNGSESINYFQYWEFQVSFRAQRELEKEEPRQGRRTSGIYGNVVDIRSRNLNQQES